MKPDQSAQSCVVAVSQPCPDLIIILTSHSYNRDYITKTQKKSLLKLTEVVICNEQFYAAIQIAKHRSKHW